MKKYLLAFSLIAATFISNAQNDKRNPITFGLAGGSNLAYLQVSSPHSEEVYSDAQNPFSAGLNADFKINDYFSIRPGIFYSGKGGTMNAVYSDSKGNNTSVYDVYKLHYLEVPLNFIGHLPVGQGANIFLGAGPYFAWGLGGTNNQKLFNNDPVTYQISYGKNGDFKSTDFGATSVLGFQGAKGWAIGANLDYGFTNILQNNNTAFDASQLKTIAVYISIGQSF